MLEMIKRDLADNYNDTDEKLLKDLIEYVTITALTIANRKDTTADRDLLSLEISYAVKSLYLLRGGEGLNGLNDGGKTSSFNDVFEKLRNDITKNNKRKNKF